MIVANFVTDSIGDSKLCELLEALQNFTIINWVISSQTKFQEVQRLESFLHERKAQKCDDIV